MVEKELEDSTNGEYVVHHPSDGVKFTKCQVLMSDHHIVEKKAAKLWARKLQEQKRQ